MSYVPIPRRRRMGLTDYRARKKALGSRGVLLAVRISGKNVTAQFIKPQVKGDVVLSSSHSHELKKHGWKGSLKSTPACYLLGLLAGRKAKEKGIEEAFLYNGVIPFVRGSRLSAFAKGVVDSGLKVPVSSEVFPNEERLSGATIASFAAKLLKEDKEEYATRFGSLVKLGLKPEEYVAHQVQVRKAIEGGG
jgi:large subunit ribosomal protein L18